MSAPLPSREELEPRVHAARHKVRVRPAWRDVEPVGPGEESVWRYPRPPRVEPVAAEVRILLDGRDVARSTSALRVIETSSPPVIYLPEGDFREVDLIERDDWALCEWKGVSRFLDLVAGDVRVDKAGWRFPHPFSDLKGGYERLVGHVALFPAKFDCRLDGEKITPQEGGYYGGWIDRRLKGPFKGAEGTEDW